MESSRSESVQRKRSRRIADRSQQSAAPAPATGPRTTRRATAITITSIVAHHSQGTLELAMPSALRKRQRLESEPTRTAASSGGGGGAGGPKPESAAATKRRRRQGGCAGGVSLLARKLGPLEVARRHARQLAEAYYNSNRLGYSRESVGIAESGFRHPPLGSSGTGEIISPPPTSSSYSLLSNSSNSILSPPSSSSSLFAQEPERNYNLLSLGKDHSKVQQPSDCNNQMDLIKTASRVYSWSWDDRNKSHECIVSNDKLEVCFHPECSESAAAIIGSQPLKRNGNYYYWEVTVFDKTYGTSVMFGLCTKQQQLHANDYCNLIGLDRNGWSLSHKGLIWHNGKYAHYTKMFPPNESVTIGLMFNSMRGELSYFMDGKNLGVAFCGLNDIQEDLYPVVGSTAKCTRMKLLGSYCGYESLMERSCFTLLNNSSDKLKFIQYLEQQRVPKNLVSHLKEIAEAVCGSQTKNKTAQSARYVWNLYPRLIKE